MHYAEQVWRQRSEERGIKIGEERGIKLGEALGEERGKENERHRSIGTAIDMCRSLGIPREAIINQLVEHYQLSREDAVSRVDERLS